MGDTCALIGLPANVVILCMWGRGVVWQHNQKNGGLPGSLGFTEGFESIFQPKFANNFGFTIIVCTCHVCPFCPPPEQQ